MIKAQIQPQKTLYNQLSQLSILYMFIMIFETFFSKKREIKYNYDKKKGGKRVKGSIREKERRKCDNMGFAG